MSRPMVLVSSVALALTVAVSLASAVETETGNAAALPPAGYIPAAMVQKVVFSHLTGQKLGVTYSQLKTKDFTDFQIGDKNFGSFTLFITSKGVPIHRFALRAGPVQVRYPARRRIIVARAVVNTSADPAP